MMPSPYQTVFEQAATPQKRPFFLSIALMRLGTTTAGVQVRF